MHESRTEGACGCTCQCDTEHVWAWCVSECSQGCECSTGCQCSPRGVSAPWGVSAPQGCESQHARRCHYIHPCMYLCMYPCTLLSVTICTSLRVTTHKHRSMSVRACKHALVCPSVYVTIQACSCSFLASSGAELHAPEADTHQCLGRRVAPEKGATVYWD